MAEMNINAKLSVDNSEANKTIQEVGETAKKTFEQASQEAKKNMQEVGGEIKKAFDASPLNAFQSSVGSVNSKVQMLFGTFTKFTTLAAGGFGITSLVGAAVNSGETLYKLSEHFGMTVSEASKFSKIMGATDSDAITAVRALSRLDNTISGTSTSAKTAKAALEAVGVSLTDSEGRLKPFNEQLEALASGFEQAEKVGLEQEFVLNTLGMKGMALIGTLREYKDAKEQVSRVKGVGLDAAEMHEIDEILKQINMQLGGLKLASGVALAPIAQEILSEILPALNSMAGFIGKNKEEIVAVTKTVVELIAVYEGLKLGMSAFQSINAFKTHIEDAYKLATTVVTSNAEQVADTKTASTQMSASYKTVETTGTSAYTNIAKASNTSKTVVLADMATISKEATASATTVKAQYVDAYTKAGNAMTLATEKAAILTAATTQTGNAATVAGAKGVAASAVMASRISSLATLAFNLAGGWMGVAMAIGMAATKLYEFNQEEKKKAKNDTIYTYNGKEYQYDEDNHTMVWLKTLKDGEKQRRNVWSDDENNAAFQAAQEQGLKIDNETGRTIKDQTDATKQSTKMMQDLESQTKELSERLMKIFNGETGDGEAKAGKSGGSGSSTPKKNNTQQEGETDAMFAMRFLMANGYTKEQSAGIVGNLMQESGGGTQTFDISARDDKGAVGVAQWMDDRLENLRAFQRDNYGGKDTLESQLAFLVHELQNDEKLANNKIKSTTNARDAAYNVDEYYERSAGTERTKRQDYAQQVYDEFDGRFGDYDSSGIKGVLDRAKQIENARTQLSDLEKSLTMGTNEITATEYENKMAKLSDEIEKKKKEIENIKNVSDDIDTSKAEELLGTYKNAKIDEINKDWEKSLDSVKQKIAQTTAEATGDYKTLADIQYENAVKQAELEEQEQIKKLSRYEGDVEAVKVAEDEKTAKVKQALKEREQSIRESFERTASLRISDGDVQGLKDLLSTDAGKDYMDWQGQKAAMQEYYDLWKQAHVSTDTMIANTAKTLQSGLDTFFQDAFIGTNSFMDSVYNLVTSVYKNILSQLTSKWSSQITSKLLGGLLGNNKSGNKTGNNKSTGSSLLSNVTGSLAQMGLSKGVSSLFGSGKNNDFGLKNFSNQLKLATSDTKSLTKMFQQSALNVGSLKDATGLLTEATETEQTVSSILGTATKPTEQISSQTLSEALIQLTTAAYSASAALSSINATGRIKLFASGGAISGPGTATSDSIPAMLSDGEFVLRAEAVNRIGIPTLNAMNEGRMKHFSAGGVVSSISSAGTVGGGSPMSINISAMDGNSVKAFLRNGGLKEIKQALFSDTRNFASKAGVW